MRMMNIAAADMEAENSLIQNLNSKVILSMVQPVFQKVQQSKSRKESVEARK